MTYPVFDRTTESHEAFFAYVEQYPDRRFDIVDGELVEVSPKPLHASLQAELTIIFGLWLRENPIGYVHTEGFHVLNDERFIPDISINAHKADNQAYFSVPPLLAVEIRSDTQSREAQRRKARRYIANGTPAVLLVLPHESLELFTADGGDTPQVFKPGQRVENIPGLDGLQVDVSALFG